MTKGTLYKRIQKKKKEKKEDYYSFLNGKLI